MSGPAGSEPGADPDLVEVRIIGLPLDVWARTQEHIDELRREFTLLAARQAEPGAPQVPARLLALMEQLEQDYQGMTVDQEAQLVAAVADGADSVDLTYRIPVSVGAAAAALEAELDAADEFCRAGRHLLTLTTPPDAVAFRRWYLGQFVDQTAGRPARSWPDWLAEQAGPGF